MNSFTERNHVYQLVLVFLIIRFSQVNIFGLYICEYSTPAGTEYHVCLYYFQCLTYIILLLASCFNQNIFISLSSSFSASRACNVDKIIHRCYIFRSCSSNEKHGGMNSIASINFRIVYAL